MLGDEGEGGNRMCSLITAVAVIGGMVLGRHPGPAPDPLSEWTCPNAKQVEGETWEEFLPWATYTTTDPFEKVWQFASAT